MNFLPKPILLFTLLAYFFSNAGCLRSELSAPATSSYATKNVVIVVIDGPRYSETWGAANHELIPKLSKELAKEGIINTAFYNQGPTYTNAGHTAITTGFHQGINNSGLELPRNPSIFQLWLEASGKPAEKAWIVTSKDKLEILANTKDPKYKDKFMPRTNCGNNGNGTGYREDSTTFRLAKQILRNHRPNLMLINFKEPDASGHAGDWDAYLKGIRDTDEYAWQLWKFLEEDPHYKNTTTFILTNDHGRHLDGHSSGFVSHGDNCDGCRHINFFASGPDFKENKLLTTSRNQTDIPKTVARLLNFELPESKGQVMEELFK